MAGCGILGGMSDINCDIWDTPANCLHADPLDDWSYVHSPRAGGYYAIHMRYTEHFMDIKQKKDYPDLRCRLSYWIWQENIKKRISRYTPYTPKKWPTITHEVVEYVKQWDVPAVDTRIQNILNQMYISSHGALNASFGILMYTMAGSIINVGNNEDIEKAISLMKAASYCINDAEFHYLLQEMGKAGLLLDNHENGVVIKSTLDGHRKIEEIQNKHSASEQAFVAMSFDKSMNDIYDNAIKPAIEAAGYRPYRIDRDPHNDKIDDRIIAKIRASKFLIADFTTKPPENARGGVYYEAGFAHGLGMQVIFMCRSEMMDGDHIHLDTRQFNYIVWKNENKEELKEKLTERIQANLGQGPVSLKGDAKKTP